MIGSGCGDGNHSQKGFYVTASMTIHQRETPTEKSTSPLTVKVSNPTLKSLTTLFKVLGDSSRLRIALALAQHGSLHVNALCGLLEQTQPAVSHHLSLMRGAGLVDFDRSGRHNFYYLVSENVARLIEQFLADWESAGQLRFEEFSLSYTRLKEPVERQDAVSSLDPVES